MAGLLHFVISALQPKSYRPSFLSLPAEIRNIIYEYVFADQARNLNLQLELRRQHPAHDLQRTLRKKMDRVRGRSTRRNALLQVNKQVHCEARHLVWDKQLVMAIFPSFAAWTGNTYGLEKLLSTERIDRSIVRAFNHIGHRLAFVSTLAMVGFDTLALMIVAPTFRVAYAAHLAKLRRDLNRAKDALVTFRWAVPRVKRIEVSDSCFDKLFKHPHGMPWLTVMASDPICTRAMMRQAFPLLVTLHFRGLEEEDAYEEYWYHRKAWRMKESGGMVPDPENPQALAGWVKRWRQANGMCPLLWM